MIVPVASVLVWLANVFNLYYLVVHNGYSYRRYRENKEGLVNWSAYEEYCKGRLFFKNNLLVRLVEDQCIAGDEKKAARDDY